MITIDGSMGEGGGQILRTAVALSAVMGETIKVTNIRAGRPNPGMSPSHVTSVEAVAKLCDAKVEGLQIGSKDMTFDPGELIGGSYRFDIGTAGSIPLVIQGCLLPALFSKSPVRIALTGGTNVKWSPPIDYMQEVHVPLIQRLGASCELKLVSRGFYPEGGGEVHLYAPPVRGLTGTRLCSQGDLLRIGGIGFSQNLPEHVVSRMRHSAMMRLVRYPEVKIAADVRTGRSIGAGILLFAECTETTVGTSALGERGVRAEALGESCANDLIETLGSGAAIDEHMADQILPYLALANGSSSVVTEEITGHVKTNITVIEKITERHFTTTETDGLVEISVD